MTSVRAQFISVQEQLDQVHNLVDSNTPSDLNKAATILKSLLPIYKDLSGNEESKRPENLEILKEIKSRLTEETQRVMSKKEEAKSLQLQQQQQQQQQLLQQQQQILESNTRSRSSTLQQELPKPPLLSGYLKKQGDKGLVRSFKKRWFQQRDTKLYYYEKEGDSEAFGFVNLPDMTSVKTVDSGFELSTPGRTYVFQIFKPSDLTYWTEGLKDFKKYYQSLQNSQKFGGNNVPSSPSLSSGGSVGDFRKYSDNNGTSNDDGGDQTSKMIIKDRRGTVSGMENTYAHSSSSTAPDSPTLSSSYAPSSNPVDDDLRRREIEIIKKHQEKEKLKKEQEDQQSNSGNNNEQSEQQTTTQQPTQPITSSTNNNQINTSSPQQSPYTSRHGSVNYSQQQQSNQTPPSPSQVIISNNNSPRFEQPPTNNSTQLNQTFSSNETLNNKLQMESYKQSIEEEMNKKYSIEKQEYIEQQVKKRIELESELKKTNSLLVANKLDSEELEKQLRGDLKNKKTEMEDLTAQVTVLENRNQTLDSRIKELESIKPIETFPHEFLWTEEVTMRDSKIAAQTKRILELEEQLKLKDNAVTVIKRENEMLRQETEKKDKYINELLEKGKSAGNSAGNSPSLSSTNSKINSNQSSSNNYKDQSSAAAADHLKYKESMVAHQTQNSFLLQEIQRLETQSQFKLDIKLQQIEDLEKQLEQQLYQFHRFREAIIGTISNEYCDKIEKENLDIKKEYFQILGISIKLHRVREGDSVNNIDINSLFEKVIKENIHYRNWPEWISNQFK